jgi:hypothetical protein
VAQSEYTSTAPDGLGVAEHLGGAYAGVSTSSVTDASRISPSTASPKSASTAGLKLE